MTEFRDGRYESELACFVCDGSGHISDVRTARDAMVDAETRVVRISEESNGEGWIVIEDGGAHSFHDSAAEAVKSVYAQDQVRAKVRNRCQVTTVEWEPLTPIGHQVVRVLTERGREAFRAVPALRGEE